MDKAYRCYTMQTANNKDTDQTGVNAQADQTRFVMMLLVWLIL